MTELLFVSDLHLSPERPDKLDLFRRLLAAARNRAEALYILGDLFDHFWIGNDDPTPPTVEIVESLHTFTEKGPRCYFLRGNRELLLDEGFTALTGCALLGDGSVITRANGSVLLMHGDRLCTRDRSYQLFRTILEREAVRRFLLSLPCRLRLFLARGLRPALQRSRSNKPPEVMDVTQAAVEHAMRTAGVTELVHGHTHRPALHEFVLDDQPARRWVLGDWYGDPRMLVCRGSGRQLVRVEEYLAQSAG